MGIAFYVGAVHFELFVSGLSDEDIKKAEEKWMDIPNAVNIRLNIGLTQREKIKLDNIAKEKNTSVNKLLMDAIEAEKKKLISE